MEKDLNVFVTPMISLMHAGWKLTFFACEDSYPSRELPPHNLIDHSVGAEKFIWIAPPIICTNVPTKQVAW
jgi:hypothetical protein